MYIPFCRVLPLSVISTSRVPPIVKDRNRISLLNLSNINCSFPGPLLMVLILDRHRWVRLVLLLVLVLVVLGAPLSLWR